MIWRLAPVILIVVTLCLSCREELTDPPDEVAGKRDYVWSIDTLAYPGAFQILMKDIWGSNAKDVYVVGGSDRNRAQMYHFDGSTWLPVRLAVSDGGNIHGPFSFGGIYGFNSNDIFVVGENYYPNGNPPPNFIDSGLVIHYDGNAWREITLDIRGSYLTTVWGANPSDVWFGGNGVLYHYDGSIATRVPFDSNTIFGDIRGYASNDIYAICGRVKNYTPPDDSVQYLFYHYDGGEWTALDSFVISPELHTWRFGNTIWISDDGKLYSSAYGISGFEGGSWRELLASNDYLKVGGSSSNNIFGVGNRGVIHHWNGSDWANISASEGMVLFDNAVWSDNVETFIVGIGVDGLHTLIFHGK
jgi:hypothetical protein